MVFRSQVTILFISNGYEEDIVGSRLATWFLKNSSIPIEVFAFPIVGEGNAYKEANITTVGVQKELPSGGLSYLSFSSIIEDLKSGLISLLLKQLSFLFHNRNRFDLIIGIGDRVSLEINGFILKKPMFWIAIADSVRYLPKGKEMGTNRMRRFMRDYCLYVFPRDQESEESLKRFGINARYVGNPVMDDVVLDESQARDFDRFLSKLGQDKNLPLVLFLPGSREDAYHKIIKQIEIINALYALKSNIRVIVAISSRLDLKRITENLRETGIYMKSVNINNIDIPLIEFQKNFTVPLLREFYVPLIHQASIVVGQAGTAIEHAAGLGKPIVTFKGSSIQSTPRFLQGQKQLLGDAISIVDSDPSKIALEVISILNDKDRYQRMSKEGREKMGPMEGTEKIGGYISMVIGNKL